MQEHSHQWQALAAKVAFLSRLSSYDKSAIVNTDNIEIIETHMSYVFFTHAYAYKLKKPVLLPQVDFVSLASRYANTVRELQINQSLAAGIYLQALPLCLTQNEQYCLLDSPEHVSTYARQGGTVIDWLLKMRRLPRQALLDQAWSAAGFQVLDVVPAADHLAAFYRSAAPVTKTPDAYVRMLRDQIINNIQNLSKPVYQLDLAQLDDIRQAQLSCLAALRPELSCRISAGRLVDGHGDLKPEHICLTSPPVIIDRLELDPIARLADPVAELSLLHIECQRLGHVGVAEVFLRRYQQLTGDRPGQLLLAFYRSLAAARRGKIAAWHVDDCRIADKHYWRAAAGEYLQAAAQIIRG